MTKKKKNVGIILSALLVVFLLTRCVSIHTPLSRGSVIYKDEYSGVEFEDTLTKEEVAAVAGVLSGKFHHSSLLVMPSCGWDWDIAIIIDGTRYMLALDTCGTVYVGGVIPGSTFCYIDISDAEQDILEAVFTSRGGTFPCI